MIKVEFNALPAAQAIDDAARRQIPFAIARALTQTAQAAQTDLREHLGDTMTIRNDWVSKGIRIKPAKKGDWHAEVGSRDKFMALQAEGGEKTGKGGGAVAVPVDVRGTPQALTRPSRWPGRLLPARGTPGRPGQAFKVPLGHGSVGVFKRKGKGPGARLVLLYALARRVEVRAHWPLAQRVEHTVARVWPALAQASLDDAIATAIKKAKA